MGGIEGRRGIELVRYVVGVPGRWYPKNMMTKTYDVEHEKGRNFVADKIRLKVYYSSSPPTPLFSGRTR
ncbi:hypothetical protein CEXT_731331 [Caerostris extrusa]|uniref:Uncharacterized protein n=1 Tax=Caerostris extrusa TaxID=172846 RepID=A0AAV4X5S4_CAEEX|nr:hypothetical protein CEXT_731331 [Caerostris extrusa]